MVGIHFKILFIFENLLKVSKIPQDLQHKSDHSNGGYISHVPDVHTLYASTSLAVDVSEPPEGFRSNLPEQEMTTSPRNSA